MNAGRDARVRQEERGEARRGERGKGTSKERASTAHGGERTRAGGSRAHVSADGSTQRAAGDESGGGKGASTMWYARGARDAHVARDGRHTLRERGEGGGTAQGERKQCKEQAAAGQTARDGGVARGVDGTRNTDGARGARGTEKWGGTGNRGARKKKGGKQEGKGVTASGGYNKRWYKKDRTGKNTTRAREMGKAWPTLGIKKASTRQIGTFHKWINEKATPDPKTSQSQETTQTKLDEWGVQRVLGDGEEAVVCIARATREVRTWHAGGKMGKRPPALRILKRIIHKRVLPTAVVAGGSDAYYLTRQRRYMVPDEMCNAFGIAKRSRLRKALVATRASGRGEATERQAMMMLGAAIHVPSLKLVLRGALARAGIRGQAQVSLYDVCSGVSTVAEAMEQVLGDRFRYLAAAEDGEGQRQILQAAWAHRGLEESAIYDDAYGEEAEAGPGEPTDVYVMTPDCSKWSRCQNKSACGEAMEETRKVEAMMKYASRTRPAVVILESVGDLLGSERVRACGERMEEVMCAGLPDYDWRAQVVDAQEHGGAPMARARAFWVGTRPMKEQHDD